MILFSQDIVLELSVLTNNVLWNMVYTMTIKFTRDIGVGLRQCSTLAKTLKSKNGKWYAMNTFLHYNSFSNPTALCTNT